MSRACLLVLHAELEGTPRQEPQRLALRVLRVHMRHLQPQRSARLALLLTFRLPLDRLRVLLAQWARNPTPRRRARRVQRRPIVLLA